MKGRVRLAYLVSHPIQYQAPLLRRLAQEPDIDLTVLFGSDFSARGYRDQGFGVEVAWDVPLLEGYKYQVLPALRDNGTVTATTPVSRSLSRPLRNADGQPAFDALWVHGYASVNSLRGIVAAHALGIPVLLRAESWSGDRKRSITKQMAKCAFFRVLRSMVAATLPIGSLNAAYWHEALGPDIPQFRVPYTVDNAFFAQRAAEARARVGALRAELALDEARQVILFASKLQPRKHADDLLRAYRPLADRLGSSPYVIIVGDGEQRSHLEELTRREGITDHVRFAGFRNQSELPALFAMADVFVLPSRHEPWGLIVNEAMAAGCPVVSSSEVGAAPDLVLEGVTGFTYPVGDAKALAAALANVLAPTGRAQQMGQAAAKRMNTWDFEADVRGLRQALAHVTGRIRP